MPGDNVTVRMTLGAATARCSLEQVAGVLAGEGLLHLDPPASPAPKAAAARGGGDRGSH